MSATAFADPDDFHHVPEQVLAYFAVVAAADRLVPPPVEGVTADAS